MLWTSGARGQKNFQISTPDYINENHRIIKQLKYDFILTESYGNGN